MIIKGQTKKSAKILGALPIHAELYVDFPINGSLSGTNWGIRIGELELARFDADAPISHELAKTITNRIVQLYRANTAYIEIDDVIIEIFNAAKR